LLTRPGALPIADDVRKWEGITNPAMTSLPPVCT
jgi:hypothetical protein